MDRAMVEASLAQAERHVGEGARRVERQREIVADLNRDGHDAEEALRLLKQFKDLQAMNIADRDRLQRQIGHKPV
jgi:hypothetical protein